MREVVTHDVNRYIVTKPAGMEWEPGQGVTLAIDEDGRREETRPFTPTSLPSDGVLEFTIKRYPDHEGVTEAMHHLKPGATLQMSDPFGTIAYRGAGTFIAAGSGITPFLPLIRSLAGRGELKGHSLLFSNKTPADVMLERELRAFLGDRCVFTCTRQSGAPYEGKRIDRDFLATHIDHFDQHFYVCGPMDFVVDVRTALGELGASSERLVFEE
jgi:cytochrome-b5 reductase